MIASAPATRPLAALFALLALLWRLLLPLLGLLLRRLLLTLLGLLLRCLLLALLGLLLLLRLLLALLLLPVLLALCHRTPPARHALALTAANQLRS